MSNPEPTLIVSVQAPPTDGSMSHVVCCRSNGRLSLCGFDVSAMTPVEDNTTPDTSIDCVVCDDLADHPNCPYDQGPCQ